MGQISSKPESDLTAQQIKDKEQHTQVLNHKILEYSELNYTQNEYLIQILDELVENAIINSDSFEVFYPYYIPVDDTLKTYVITRDTKTESTIQPFYINDTIYILLVERIKLKIQKPFLNISTRYFNGNLRYKSNERIKKYRVIFNEVYGGYLTFRLLHNLSN